MQTVETVAATPAGPLAFAMRATGARSGSGSSGGFHVVLRHRAGNLQMLLSNGQRWHLPRGKSIKDVPSEDEVGDRLQEAALRAAKEWGPRELTRNEQAAIEKAQKEGKYWVARRLEREARGRYVERKVRAQFEQGFRWNHRGVDVVDLSTGRQYEILSGTRSNLALHGRRMANELFRMIAF